MPDAAIFEVAPQQAQIWHHQKLDKAPFFYQISMMMKISGHVDYSEFQQSIHQIVSEQLSLRSYFYEENGVVYQSVQSDATIPMGVTDLREYDDHSEDIAYALSRRLSRMPIPLEREYAFKYHVYRVNSNTHWIVFIMHHIVVDGYSWKCFFESIFRYYKDNCGDNTLRESGQQYISQRKKGYSRDFLSYWRAYLDGLPILRLPIKGPRPNHQKFSGSVYTFPLPDDYCHRIKQATVSLNLTESMIFMAAFQLSLHYLSNQNDFGIGVPTANRTSKYDAGIISCHINTLVYRANVKRSSLLSDFLGDVLLSLLEVISHADYQFCQLANKIQCERSPGFSPLFQVMYIYQDLPFYSNWDSQCGLMIDLEELEVGATVFELTFEIRKKSNGAPYIYIRYRHDLYSEDFIKSLIDIFFTMLDTIISDRVNTITITHIFDELDQLVDCPPMVKSHHQMKALTDVEAPRSPTSDLHYTLSSIWQNVLKRPMYDIDTNFFHLSGNSLLAMQLLNQVQERLGVIISFRDFFSNSTISGMSEIIDNKSAKRDNRFSKIPRVSESDYYATSYSQEQLCFIHLLDPDNVAYHVAGYIKFTGETDFQHIESSINYILRHHDALRTIYTEKQGDFYQSIVPYRKLALERIRLSDENALQSVDEYCESTVRSAFHLDSGPLYRFVWVESSCDHFKLVMCFHHSIFDGWSFRVFLDEFKSIYRALLKKEKIEPTANRLRYIDYAQWQRDSLLSLSEKKLDFWRNTLQSNCPAELLLDMPRPKYQSFKGRKIARILPKVITKSLRTLASSHEMTFFQLLLSAYTILVYAINDIDDFVVGVPDAARDSQELENIIGLFVTILPVRIRVDPSMTLLEHAIMVQQIMIDVLSNKSVPFDLMIKNINLTRDPSRNPLVQIAFNFLNIIDHDVEITPDLHASCHTIENFGAKYDLSLMIIDQGDILRCELEYDDSLFFSSTIEHYLDCFSSILERFCECTRSKISELNWNSKISAVIDTTYQHRPDNIVQCFKQQVSMTPDNIAVVSKDTRMTYEQLDTLSDALSFRLSRAMPKPLAKVALLFEHDAYMLVAVLGILKAGAAYIPIHPDYPSDFVGDMLAYAQPDILLMPEAMSNILPDESIEFSHNIQLSDGCWRVLSYHQHDVGDREVLSITQNQIAYILFTSGTTGSPKPIYQSHRNVIKHVSNYIDALEISSEDRVLQMASLTHDAAVMDIYSALISGATLFLSTLSSDSLHSIHQIIQSEKITIIHTTPSVFKHLFNSPGKYNHYQSVNQVVLGGESIDHATIDLFNRYFSDHCQFNNLYGSTEYSFSFVNRTVKPFCHRDQSFSVGKPLIDAKIKLVGKDGYHHPLCGELVYQNDTMPINQAINNDGKVSGFYTGDLFRVCYDGSYQFIGRKDFQVKIRGHRVNLDQVKSCLNTHDDIRDSVLHYKLDGSGGFLYAFYVHKDADNSDYDTQRLQSYLTRQLPSYMLPNFYVSIPSIPYNKHGKLDRTVLLDLISKIDTGLSQGVSSCGEVEKKIVDIWQDILMVPVGDLDISFFDLGGHSLLLTVLQERIRQDFNMEIPLVEFFSHTTISKIADYIKSRLSDDTHGIETPQKNSTDIKKRSDAILRRKKKTGAVKNESQ